MNIIYKINIVLFMALLSMPLIAQSHIGNVRISNPVIDKNEETVTVRFIAEIGNKAVRRNYSLVFGPELTDGTYRWSLPVIIVQGRGAKTILNRHIFASKDSEGEAVFENAIFTDNGKAIDYVAHIPYQEWMEGANLFIEAVKSGCCSSSAIVVEVLTENLKLQSEPVVFKIAPDTMVIPKLLSTAEKLAQVYPFVIPVEKQEEMERRSLLFNEDRENTITVLYRVNSYDIDHSFLENSRSLQDLISAIHKIENSTDSEVATVVVAGFASPEGGFELNDKLAWNRAVSTKEYIIQNSGLNAEQIKIINGSSDWQGLRMMVEASDMPWKHTVLNIIDTVPVWSTQKQADRLSKLMSIDNGIPYSYMLEHYFPKLRNSAYIRVYYRNKNNENEKQ